MAENVPVGGFNVPSVPAGAQVNERSQPAAANMQPGFVPPAAPAGQGGTFTQADIDAAVAAATRQPAAPAVPAAQIAPLVPGAAIHRPPTELTTANDPVLSSMTAVFTSVGGDVDLDRAVGKALMYGDASLIDLAYLTEKGGANAAHLTVMAKAIVERVQAQAEAGAQAVFAVAGDQAQWQAAAAVFDQSAPAHTKLVIKQMLDSGNPQAISAAAKSVVEFAQSSGQLVQRPGLVQAGAAQLSSAQGLDKVGFQAELRKLAPNSRSYEADRAQLFQRRSLGKSLGL
jgi:hypothetical protein